MTATKWEYRIINTGINIDMADRWSSKKQAAELEQFQARLNAAGSDGWEMVGYESVPLYGSFSDKLKGYAYLVFFKRPALGSPLGRG